MGIPGPERHAFNVSPDRHREWLRTCAAGDAIPHGNHPRFKIDAAQQELRSATSDAKSGQGGLPGVNGPESFTVVVRCEWSRGPWKRILPPDCPTTPRLTRLLPTHWFGGSPGQMSYRASPADHDHATQNRVPLSLMQGDGGRRNHGLGAMRPMRPMLLLHHGAVTKDAQTSGPNSGGSNVATRSRRAFLDTSLAIVEQRRSHRKNCPRVVALA